MVSRHLLWTRLPDQRPGRELSWLAQMPDTQVTEVGSPRTHGPESGIDWIPRDVRRPVRRFVEAGAFGWLRDLGSVDPTGFQWVASLELCALVTGQASRFAVRHGLRQAVITWENMAHQPLYRIPPYAQAARRALGADLMVCPIEAARDHLLALGYPEERIAVVLPGVDLEAFGSAAELGVERDEDLVVFVSPLAPNKGIDRVLDAFEVLRRRRPGARLAVAGQGPMRSLVEERAADSRGRIQYVGSLDRAGVARLLASAGVFVTAPRPTWKWNEQFGLAYLEAMAAGLPIVTTVCGTNYEAVRPPNLRVPDTVGDLAAGLAHFLDNRTAARAAGKENLTVVAREHDIRRQVVALGAAFTTAEQLPPRRRTPGGRPQ